MDPNLSRHLPPEDPEDPDPTFASPKRSRISRAELDEIYGFVPLELRDCKHPNLASLPADLTCDVVTVAENVGAVGFMAERRCPDCGAWVRLAGS